MTPKDITPLGNLVLIQSTKLSRTIHVVTNRDELPPSLETGVVVAVGPGDQDVNGNRVPVDDGKGNNLKPGQAVMFLNGMSHPVPDMDDLWFVPVPALAATLDAEVEELPDGGFLLAAKRADKKVS